jgi:hypothetical protein
MLRHCDNGRDPAKAKDPSAQRQARDRFACRLARVRRRGSSATQGARFRDVANLTRNPESMETE